MFVDLSNAGKNTGGMRVWFEYCVFYDKMVTKMSILRPDGLVLLDFHDGPSGVLAVLGQMSTKSLKMGLK